MQKEAYEKILFEARRIATIPTGNYANNALAATALKNLEDYGFTFGKRGYELLSGASKEEIKEWYLDMVKSLNELTGGNHKYRPFYPNFPEEVMEKSDLELYIDQIIHYMTGYLPEEENRKENIKSLEEHPLKVLDVLSNKDKEKIRETAKEIFANLLKTKTNVSLRDAEIIKQYIEVTPDWTKEVGIITNRNLLSHLYAIAIKEKLDTSNFPALVTNDYLRIAKAAAGNYTFDTDLADKKIENIPRSLRKVIVKGLDMQKNLEEDVARNKTQFKVLFQKLHVGEYKNHVILNEVADKLRNNERLETFYGKIEEAFKENDIDRVVDLYRTRPGEFIKNINRILMAPDSGMDQEEVVRVSKKMFHAAEGAFRKTRPEDLINFMEYIKSRTREERIDVHNVKGKLVKGDHHRKAISPAVAEAFIGIAKKAIGEQIKTGKNYGKVYIEPGMDKMVLPKDTKDASNAMNAYTKGSRIALEKNDAGEEKNIRVFIWWTNTSERRVDIDLSATTYELKDATGEKGSYFAPEEGKKISRYGEVSFRSHFMDNGLVHSGDVTDGGPEDGAGVCEYIDIDTKCLKEQGVKYVIPYINVFAGDTFKDMKNCECGWMVREELDETKQFDIKAVQNHSKMTANALGATLFAYDVQNGEIVYLDTPEYRIKRLGTTVDDGMRTIEVTLDRYAHGDRMSMGEMARLAVEVNGGEIVSDPKDADTLFVINGYEDKTDSQRVITSKEQDVWLGEFMSPQAEEKTQEAARDIGDVLNTIAEDLMDLPGRVDDIVNEEELEW